MTDDTPWARAASWVWRRLALEARRDGEGEVAVTLSELADNAEGVTGILTLSTMLPITARPGDVVLFTLPDSASIRQVELLHRLLKQLLPEGVGAIVTSSRDPIDVKVITPAAGDPS